MTGALLSEVWPDMVQKPKKTKRLKKKKTEDPLFDSPLTPDEIRVTMADPGLSAADITVTFVGFTFNETLDLA